MKEQRNTRQRAMILETVRDRRDHPTADQIYQEVRSRSPKISRGTVYRNLNLLSENGDIRQVKMPDVDRFDWRSDRHYHLRCTSCGLVSDVPIAYQEELDQLLAEQTDYQVKFHRTIFEGLCPECGANEEKTQEDAAV